MFGPCAAHEQRGAVAFAVVIFIALVIAVGTVLEHRIFM
jgi:hypothetical protein